MPDRLTTAEETGVGLVDFAIHISKDEALATVRLAPVEHPDEVLSVQFGQRKKRGKVPLMTSVTVTPEVFAGLAELIQDSAA